MFDPMIGAVAFAMREERLTRARRNLLLIEAEQANTGQRTRRRFASRERIAQGLAAQAARLAPSVTKARTGTGAMAR